MAKRKARFNGKTPKIVNIAFTFQGEPYMTGEPFPPEGIEVSTRLLKSLYINHRLDDAPIVENEVAEITLPPTEPQQPETPVSESELSQEQTLFGPEGQDENDENVDDNIDENVDSEDDIVELGTDGDAVVTKPWES